ncbi:MAG: cytosine deaminase [Defluviicoccus sp.]|nr:cytosine deaminase [Defluviicoccus sp.]MDE0380851.1 cytosine deaminase [Rhodospirillales bacterium]
MTSFALRNARVPHCLLADPPAGLVVDGEGLALVDIAIEAGRVGVIGKPSARLEPGDRDLDGGQVWPCFADIHTHLDIGHIWTRASNADGTFRTAARAVAGDRDANWSADDLRARMEFGLRCSYARGTKAIRTHLQSPPGQAETSWGVFRELRDDWRGRIELQGVNLLMVEEFRDGKSDAIVDLVARSGGIVGAVIFMIPDIDEVLDRIFRLASERSLDLDLHVDESLEVRDKTLRHVAEAALRHRFSGRIQCGHCCSLAVQSAEEADRTLDLVAEAGIAVVSLPMCNAFLMDREAGRTPRRRGVTLVREMAARGIQVSFASDNCRDPFYGYGDHDMLEVFGQAARIAHIDLPMNDWPRSVTATPIEVMGLDSPGLIGVGGTADLVLFRGRGYSELLSRHESGRAVLRGGEAIDTVPPDYRELDRLFRSPA